MGETYSTNARDASERASSAILKIEKSGGAFNSPVLMTLKSLLVVGGFLYLAQLLVNLHRHFENATARRPSWFDSYGGGLDFAFLGFGQVDAEGNVNASKLGGVAVGPGGFIDMAQNAKKVVFFGTFDAKGAQIGIADGRITIHRHGEIRKFVPRVDQITFSGKQAARQGQEILYVT